MDPSAGPGTPSRRDGDAEVGTLEAASPWVTCLCSVEFDLDVGQKIEAVVPEGALSAEEQADVAFHAFPDSMSLELHAPSCVRDSSFLFRVFRSRWLYGFVFCRQRQDERLARGADQRAVVVVSAAPFSSALRPLSKLLGIAYFNEGPMALADIYGAVRAWPGPQGLTSVRLAVGPHSITATVPPFSVFPPPVPKEVPELTRAGSIPNPKLTPRRSSGGDGGKGKGEAESNWALFQEVDAYSPFKSQVSRLWSLWELALTGQPLAVVAPSPGECSNGVASLISIIAPVPYAEDFRPYYTIHDPTFQKLMAACDEAKKANEPLVLGDEVPHLVGVTNLYFIKALPAWPNVLSIGERPAIAGPAGAGAATPAAVPPQGLSTLQRLNPKYAYQAMRLRMLKAQVLLSQHMENLWCEEPPLTRPDEAVCSRLQDLSSKAVDANRLALLAADSVRRHFWTLTAAFLEPFQRFFMPVFQPPREGINGGGPSMGSAVLPGVDFEAFLATLCPSDIAPVMKERFACHDDCLDLYRLFMESRNFEEWFATQRRNAANGLGIPYTDDFCTSSQPADGVVENGSGIEPVGEEQQRDQGWSCESEVLAVERFFELEEAMMAPKNGGKNGYIDAATRDKIITLFQSMPPDLMQALLSSPSRAEFASKLRGVTEISEQLDKLQIG